MTRLGSSVVVESHWQWRSCGLVGVVEVAGCFFPQPARTRPMQPDRAACERLAAEGYTFIPVVRRLVADELTPVAALARLADRPHSFLFESVVGGERLARYSMLGVDPVERLIGDLQTVRIERDGHAPQALSGEPYAAIRDYMARFNSPDLPLLPRFCGGLVGYFGYDVVRLAEHLPQVPSDDLGLPDIYLMRFDTVVVFDHSFNHLLLVTHLDLTAGASVDAEWQRAEGALSTLQASLERPHQGGVVDVQPCEPLAYTQHTSQAKFEAAVEQIKGYIRAGDIFQAVPSQRLSAAITVNPFQVYRSVRSLNPSPYMFCLRMGEASLVGASPEIMVRVEDGKVVVRPIAGTIHRGATPAEDEILAQQLLAETQNAILPLVPYLDTLRWVFIVVAFGGIAVTIYARLDDWRRGRR